jgi:hypothetical protein
MDCHNTLPLKNKSSPVGLFSSSPYEAPLHQFHHFGCPTYVLDCNLQANKRSRMKWSDRTRLGIHLGFSPQHAKSTHLVLSLTTGLVSPQFPCKFDNNFTTISEYNLPASQWQEKAHTPCR